MTRSQLITKVANETNLSCSEVEKVMDGIFGTIGDVLKSGDKVTIAGFGRFEMRERQTKNFHQSQDQGHQQAGAYRHPRFQGQRSSEGQSCQVITRPKLLRVFPRRGKTLLVFVFMRKKTVRPPSGHTVFEFLNLYAARAAPT